jgi:sec-independent protein translocase protein TatA
VVILMLFGAKRLPEMGRSLGTGMREFRDGVVGRDSSPAHQGALDPPAESGDRIRDGDPMG